MAKKEKTEFFGEETKTPKRGRPAKIDNAEKSTTRKKYTRRAKQQDDVQLVTIRVPASLAFQVGPMIGQA